MSEITGPAIEGGRYKQKDRESANPSLALLRDAAESQGGLKQVFYRKGLCSDTGTASVARRWLLVAKQQYQIAVHKTHE